MEDIKEIIIKFATALNNRVEGFDCYFNYTDQRRKKDGYSVVFQGVNDKQVIFPKDNIGNYFYVRINKPISYKFVSHGIFDLTIPLKLVVWVKAVDIFELEYIIRRGMIDLGILNYTAFEYNAFVIASGEAKPFQQEVPDDITLLSIDFQLNERVGFCGNCKLKLPCPII